MTARQYEGTPLAADAPDCAGRNGVHTPGPWDWRNDINGGEYDLSPGILTTVLTDGTPWGDEIDRANARLIAAAPDLLDALKLVDAYLYATAPRSNERDIVLRAIARATGAA